MILGITGWAFSNVRDSSDVGLKIDADAKTELATEKETEISDRGRLMDKSEYIEWMTHEKPGTKKTAS